MGLTELKIATLPRKPDTRGCQQINAAWRYLGSAHRSVSGLFDAFNILRQAAHERTGEARGAISNDLQDQLRAAIVFTSAGLDACMTRLLKDALPVLVNGNRIAEREFRQWCSSAIAPNGSFSKSILPTLLDRDPRGRLIELYIVATSAPSLQSTGDLKKIRQALGLEDSMLPTDQIDGLAPFFKARNEIAHELDLTEPTGPGTRSRRQRDMDAVRDQCNQTVQLIAQIIRSVSRELRGCYRNS